MIIQEEGWVVCRAFKKPSPNKQPNLNAWHNAYYIRGANTSNYRPNSSLSEITRTPMHHQPLNNINAFNQTTNFHQLAFHPSHQNMIINMSSTQNFFENQVLVELPQLDSPTISTSFCTKDNISLGEQSYTVNYNNEDDHGDEEKQSNGINNNQIYGDWKNIDTLIEPPSHISHLLECFPDL